ncbi:MAG: hypothetical protein HN356_10565 [Calditrichaeota bacterium]|nr:hypothetical protein [Calditrichota bacterium]
MIPETSELTVSRNTVGVIKLETVITDSQRVGIAGVRLRYQISEFSEDSPVFGSISGSNFTDETGRAEATFRSDLGSGTVYVSVFIDDTGYEGMFARAPLTIRILENEIGFVSISGTPSGLCQIHPDSLTVTEIRLTVRDNNNNGIPNMHFAMSTDIGRLSEPSLTDSAGVMIVQHFVRPAVDVEHEGNFTVTITAEFPDSRWSRTLELHFKVYRTLGSLTLTTDQPGNTIIADGPGGSVARLTAVLQDADGQILAGEEIFFTKSFENCTIQSPIETDYLGRAQSIFDDNGVPSVDERGMPIPVILNVSYPPMGLEKSLEISIIEQQRVSRIDLNSNRRQLTANGIDSMEFRATCYMTNGSPAPVNTEVHFETIYGRWDEDIVLISGSAGSCDNVYYAPDFICVDTSYVWVANPNDTLFSNPIIVNVVSGPPGEILIEGVPDTAQAGGPIFIRLVATILDAGGNPVRQGTFVTLRSTLFSNPQSGVTDIDGQAVMLIQASREEPGFGTITVIAGGVEKTVRIEFI